MLKNAGDLGNCQIVANVNVCMFSTAQLIWAENGIMMHINISPELMNYQLTYLINPLSF